VALGSCIDSAARQHFVVEFSCACLPKKRGKEVARLGKKYKDGEIIIRQGETGSCMYVIQQGEVEVVVDAKGQELKLRTLGPNDFFGEMALFEEETRTATVRTKGTARILTIDKKSFLGGIHEDPSLAFRIVQTMSHRIRDLTDRLAGYEQHD
jgi:CRP/FNR family transcriptional regulator